jgi:hypothetical protein
VLFSIFSYTIVDIRVLGFVIFKVAVVDYKLVKDVRMLLIEGGADSVLWRLCVSKLRGLPSLAVLASCIPGFLEVFLYSESGS